VEAHPQRRNDGDAGGGPRPQKRAVGVHSMMRGSDGDAGGCPRPQKRAVGVHSLRRGSDGDAAGGHPWKTNDDGAGGFSVVRLLLLR